MPPYGPRCPGTIWDQRPMTVGLRPSDAGGVEKMAVLPATVSDDPNGALDEARRPEPVDSVRLRAPLLVWIVSAIFTSLGMLFYDWNRDVPGTESLLEPVMPTVALVFPAIGAFIASRRPRNPVGWLFCSGVFLGLAFLAEQYATHVLITEPESSLPGGAWAAWIGRWAWVPGSLLPTTLLALLFPDGHLPSRRWYPVAWAAGAVIAATTALAALAPGRMLNYPTRNPVAIEELPQLWTLAQALTLVCVFVLAPACLGGLLARYRRASSEQRGQLRWFMVAGALAVGAPFSGISLDGRAYDVVSVVALLAMPVMVTAAVLRRGLYDVDAHQVDTLISRALVYVSLAAAVVGVLWVVLRLLDALFSWKRGLPPWLVALAVAGIAVGPLRRRLQAGADRLLYGKREYAALAGLGHCLESTLDPDAVLPAMAETIASALKVPYVAVEVGHGQSVTASAVHGEPRDDGVALPLVHQNETVGRLVVAPRHGQSLDPSDLHLLHDLATQAGMAAYGVRLTADLRRSSADLQRSRERLVAAREEERRRLRRDLHDGLGPVMAGVSQGLGAVHNILPRDPSAAEELLARLKSELQTAVGDVRSLVEDLRPLPLDEVGLVGALRQQAAMFGPPGGDLRVSVEAGGGLEGLPAAVEVAAYRIGLEALANVARHAKARHCTISLFVDDGGLRVEVRDDGIGLPANPRRGVGLSAMSERAGELGGNCSIESIPEGGTRVRAWMPLGNR